LNKRFGKLMLMLSLATVLTGCGTGQKKSSKSSSAKSTVTRKKTTKKKPAKKAMQASQQSTQKQNQNSNTDKKQSSAAKTVPAMNFEQIEEGNYTSLLGNWRQVAVGVNHQGGKGFSWVKLTSDYIVPLTITENEINFKDYVIYHGQTMDVKGERNARKLKFKTSKGSLEAYLKNQEAAINYGLSFYPKNVSFIGGNSKPAADVKKDRIMMWSSNDSYTQVYQRDN